MWEYRAAVPMNAATLGEVVHDGDTVKILIDLGFDVRSEKWIRLAGVRAPEVGQPGASQARAFVATWLMTRAGFAASTERKIRWPLKIVTEMTTAPEPTERTSFARYIGTIYDADGGTSLNTEVQSYLLKHPEWPVGKEL